MCSRLDDSEDLMEEGRLAGLDGTIMQVSIRIMMPTKYLANIANIDGEQRITLNAKSSYWSCPTSHFRVSSTKSLLTAM